ncbi:MAG: hypothetical protein QOK10_795 [Pseudonocardiales bacterium]|jgi:NADPH-dependent ferric siderophore reductase|nr:hypothetical protein [Pseudonocardiales bacterium]
MTDVRTRKPRTPLSSTVLSRQRLSDSLVRIVLAGGELGRLATGPINDYTDAYVKLLFLHPDADYDRPLDLDAIRASHPAEHWPRLRTYTVRDWNAERAELTLDVVVHGDQGLAGPWADRAEPGEDVLLLGPGGGYAPDPSADWQLLIGDESALPAIAVAASRLPADSTAKIFIEVHGAADEISLDVPPAAELNWLHRGDNPVGVLLVSAVTGAEWPAGRVHAFVHGEAGAVKQLRRFLRVERGIPAADLSISGYWRLGADDEAWRASKAEWNRQVEAEESAAGAV